VVDREGVTKNVKNTISFFIQYIQESILQYQSRFLLQNLVFRLVEVACRGKVEYRFDKPTADVEKGASSK
jgi:hypothetical protein